MNYQSTCEEDTRNDWYGILKLPGLLITLMIIVIFDGCSGKEDPVRLPTVRTIDVTGITDNYAKGGGIIIDNGGSEIIARGLAWGVDINPTLDSHDGLSSVGAGTGNFYSIIENLIPDTKYYVRAYATNSAGTSYGHEISFISTLLSSTITDIDGNVYKTIKIGTQEWMTENLKTTTLNDGTAIPYVTDGAEWQGLTTPAYSWYNNDVSNKSTYGALYNWYVVGTAKLCPLGWHVPNENDWRILISYSGGTPIAGAKLKEVRTRHWAYPNTGATNETGFTALPGGYRASGGGYVGLGFIGYWWSRSGTIDKTILIRIMFYESTYAYSDYFNMRAGLSVRCVKN